MSYYVTITRKPSPYWAGGPVITEAEWREIPLEQGFRPPTESERADRAPVKAPIEFIWTGHPDYPDVWFDWYDGQIDVKGPDEITLALMGRLAARLNAHLMGENGERYDNSGKFETVVEFPKEPGTKRPPWWQGIVQDLKNLWPWRQRPKS